MATASNLSNRINFSRLGHASQDVMPNILQQILLVYEPESDILTDCQKNPYLKKMNGDEWNKISKASTEGYKNFDVALLYKLFRNLPLKTPPSPLPPYKKKTKPYDHPHPPSPHEKTIGDEIERFKNLRNDILHRGNTHVTDAELKDYFKKFKEIAQRLENLFNVPNGDEYNFVAQFEYLETCCMDEKSEAEYIRKLENMIENSLQNVHDRISALEAVDRDEIQFITPLRNKTCYEGETVSLECTVAGGKRPFKWYKDGVVAYSDHLLDESKDQTYKITILHATRNDSGPYTILIAGQELVGNLTVIERKPSLIDLRKYQIELAEMSLKGENTIICAGTNAGKTFVAFHIIEDHLLKNPKGKVVFINRTNVLLEQQYQRACKIFTTLHFQGKIYKWQAGENDEAEFADIFNRTSLLFLTPKSLSNHLDENARVRVSLEDISLIILDECHHTYDKNMYNEVMSHYRIYKYGRKSRSLPQVLGLTASPGTNKAKFVSGAVDHLRKIMANLDVTKLSVVKENKEELLQYSATPSKVSVRSSSRQFDPVKDNILEAIQFVERILSCHRVIEFLTINLPDTQNLLKALLDPPREKSEVHYIQWIVESRQMTEHVLLRDPEVPRLLQTCFRHLELYAECLEVNSLLEVAHVRNMVADRYGFLSSESQRANTSEEIEVVEKLREVLHRIVDVIRGGQLEENPDISQIISLIMEQNEKFGEESRFLIFVKARATAEALAERLSTYIRSTHLTGSHKSHEESGRTTTEQLEVVDCFRNGEYQCVVATSVACEGLDIQQCNMMIRYKFVANEISSFQMRGRIRQKEGTEVILGNTKEFEFEELNIQRQYLMAQAVDLVLNLNQDTLERDISIAQRRVFDIEEMERRAAKLKINQKVEAKFSVNCKICGIEITDGRLLRHINNKRLYIVCDKAIFGKIMRKPISKKKAKTFDGCTKADKVYGQIEQCTHNWGSIIIYQQTEFVSLSQDYIKCFERVTKRPIDCKKWSDLPFVVEELTDQDIFQYNSAE